LSGTTATQHIKLAEILLDRSTAGDIEEAADLLDQWATEAKIPFPDAHFRWQLAALKLAEATGNRDTARRAARMALDLAARGPVFTRHRTVGLVETDELTLKRLRKIAQ
jgi:hypothetical protein